MTAQKLRADKHIKGRGKNISNRTEAGLHKRIENDTSSISKQIKKPSAHNKAMIKGAEASKIKTL